MPTTDHSSDSIKQNRYFSEAGNWSQPQGWSAGDPTLAPAPHGCSSATGPPTPPVHHAVIVIVSWHQLECQSPGHEHRANQA